MTMIDTDILNMILAYLQCDQIGDPCDMFYMLECETCRLGILIALV
jgi:hypothetical protein